jgi:hypothetical protein
MTASKTSSDPVILIQPNIVMLFVHYLTKSVSVTETDCKHSEHSPDYSETYFT